MQNARAILIAATIIFGAFQPIQDSDGTTAIEAAPIKDIFNDAPDNQYILVSSGGSTFTGPDEKHVKENAPFGFPGQKGVGESTIGELRILFKQHGIYTDIDMLGNLTIEQRQEQIRKKIVIYKQLARETRLRHRIQSRVVQIAEKNNPIETKKGGVLKYINKIRNLFLKE